MLYLVPSTTDTSISSPSSSFCTTPPLSPTSSVSSMIANIDMKKCDLLSQQLTNDSGVSLTSLYNHVEKERRKSRKLARLRRVRSRLAARNVLSTSDSSESTPVSTAPVDICRSGNNCNSRRALFTPSPPSTCTAALDKTNLPPTNDLAVSAETVALSLLGHFSQIRLPQQCEMEWLVTETDAPQNVCYTYHIFNIITSNYSHIYPLVALTDASELARQSRRTIYATKRKRH